MTIETATPEAQYEVRRRSVIAADATQRFANRADPITAGQAADIDTALTALLTALTAAGFGAPVDPLVASVANGATVNVENSAGDLDSPGTAVVAASAITGVRLAATKTILTSGTKVNAVAVTGTGNFATPTIAAGVLTGIVLSAS